MGTIATATYGRSEMGLRNLKSNLQSNCSVMIKRLTGDEYKNMINTIRTYWAGADADDFVKDLSSSVSNITASIKKVSTTAQSALDADLRGFKSFQAKNVTK